MSHAAAVPGAFGRAEAFNCASHLVGAILAAAGLVPLVVIAARGGDPWRITGVAVFGATLVSLYGASSAYHGLRGRLRALFQRLDHAAIYLLIAGTWTPVALVEMRDARGLTLLGAIWGLAAVGIGFVFRRGGPPRWLPAVLGLVMGWLGVFALGPLSRALPTAGLVLIIVGGLLYTGGVVFYALDQRLAFGHGLFHVLVLGGSVAHYLVVLLYLA
jgi:hemolysin III